MSGSAASRSAPSLPTTLDPKTYLATIRMSIDPEVQLPDDTVAQVTSSGLLGDKYMSLAPGGSDKMIPPGGKIQYTQSSISLENLIGQMMFSTPGVETGDGAERRHAAARVRRRLAPKRHPRAGCAGPRRSQVTLRRSMRGDSHGR